MTIIVEHYGVHRTADNVVYLHQGGKGANFIRLPEASPFEVDRELKTKCPHKIHPDVPLPDREVWEAFQEVLRDELTKYCLPIPKDRDDYIPFLPDGDPMLLLLLSKLSSPTVPIVYRFEDFTIGKQFSQLQVTNVGPVILTDIQPEHQRDLEAMVSRSIRWPRRIVLSGNHNMVVTPPMKRVRTHLDKMDSSILYSLPMETLGAVALKRWARDEQINAPWTRT